MYICSRCGKEFETERGLQTHTGIKHDLLPKEKLTELYIHRNLSAREIADDVDVSHRAVKDKLTKYDLWGKDPAKFHLEEEGMAGPFAGYPRWTHTGTGHRVRVHRLLMIADGEDPHKVFSGEYSVDHINGCPLDNRTENLRLMGNADHGSKDGHKSDTGYTHEEYLIALISDPPAWAEELGTGEYSNTL